MSIEHYITWGGGACPVEYGTLVDVLHRSGAEYYDCGAGAGYCQDWEYYGGYSAIVGWRLSADREKFLKLNHEGTDIKQKKDWHLKELAGFMKTPVRSFKIEYDDEGEVIVQYYDTKEYTDPLYKQIPYEVYELMAKYDFHPDWENYLRVGLQDKTQISYTEPSPNGRTCKTVSSKIGRYLKKNSSMTDPQIAEISALYRIKVVADLGITFARTREEIKKVYLEGPSSCMSHHLSDYSTDGIHPCEIYATPDVSVAYVKRKGQITGRTVINEVKKTYVRFYGDEALLAEGLGLQGYKAGNLDGCSLLLLKNDNDVIIAPYLDGSAGYVEVHKDMLLVSSDGGYCAERQDGLLMDDGHYCDQCKTSRHSNINYSEYHQEHICDDCLDDYTYAYYSHSDSRTYIHNSHENFYEFRGIMYTGDSLSYNGLVELSDGEICDEGDSVYSEIDDQTYKENDRGLLWYYDPYGNYTATMDNKDQVVETEDSGDWHEKEECYEYNGLYYAEKDNMLEAKVEDEKTTEVA